MNMTRAAVAEVCEVPTDYVKCDTCARCAEKVDKGKWCVKSKKVTGGLSFCPWWTERPKEGVR